MFARLFGSWFPARNWRLIYLASLALHSKLTSEGRIIVEDPWKATGFFILFRRIFSFSFGTGIRGAEPARAHDKIILVGGHVIIMKRYSQLT